MNTHTHIHEVNWKVHNHRLLNLCVKSCELVRCEWLTQFEICDKTSLCASSFCCVSTHTSFRERYHCSNSAKFTASSQEFAPIRIIHILHVVRKWRSNENRVPRLAGADFQSQNGQVNSNLTEISELQTPPLSLLRRPRWERNLAHFKRKLSCAQVHTHTNTYISMYWSALHEWGNEKTRTDIIL